MKIFAPDIKMTFEIDVKNPTGESHLLCPNCSADRKKSMAKCFSWNNPKGVGNCKNCDVSFVLYKELDHPREPFRIPDANNTTKLVDKHLKWFNSRMITQEALNKLCVYSSEEWMPQFNTF